MTRTRMAPIVPPAIAPVLLVPVTPSGSGSAAEGRDTDIMCACMLMCAHLYIHLHACLVHHQCHYTGHRLLQNGCSSIWIKVCPRAITRFLLPSCFLHSSQQWGSRDTEYIIRIISQSCVILKPAVVPCALNADIPPPSPSHTKHTFYTSGLRITPAARQQAVHSWSTLELIAIGALVGYRATRKPFICSVHFGISVQKGEGDVHLRTKV